MCLVYWGLAKGLEHRANQQAHVGFIIDDENFSHESPLQVLIVSRTV